MCPKEHQQKAGTQPARKEKEKEKENERSSRRASVSRSKNHASAGGKKVDRDVCAGRGAPKTFGGKARSVRDRLP